MYACNVCMHAMYVCVRMYARYVCVNESSMYPDECV